MNAKRCTALVAVLLAGLTLGGSASARSATSYPLVEHWDGNAWSRVAVPSVQYGLDAVVAPSATDVWAFGQTSVAEHWNGTSWRKVTLPAPPGVGVLAFPTAAAASPHDVWAVGYVSSRHAPEHSILDHWNGRSWKTVPYPGTGKYSEINGIAALASNNVWAVGDAGVVTSRGLERLTLTLHWNGTAWKRVPSPQPETFTTPPGSVHNVLGAVSGSATNDVWAVGQYDLSANGVHGSRALTLHWNGRRWKLVSNPDFVAHHVSWLSGVSASATGVWAVGGANRHGAQHALAERWTGQHWSVVQVGGPSLVGVSSLAASDAWVAGAPDGPGRVMHWDGHVWTLATKLSGKQGISAVAEVSPTDVWAVGGHFSS